MNEPLKVLAHAKQLPMSIFILKLGVEVLKGEDER